MNKTFFVLLLLPVLVMAQPGPPATTPYTRSWLRSTDSATAIANLGLSATATNVGFINLITTNASSKLTNEFVRIINGQTFTVKTTNFIATIQNTGSGDADDFLVQTPSHDVLFRLFPIGASKSNYFTLICGAFGVTNGVNADLSDVFFRQSAVGYHAYEFGDETNSFWFTGDSVATWSAHAGDLGGIGDAYKLFDSAGNLYLNDSHLTNQFAPKGATTNFSLAGITLYFTNGALKRTSIP